MSDLLSISIAIVIVIVIVAIVIIVIRVKNKVCFTEFIVEMLKRSLFLSPTLEIVITQNICVLIERTFVFGQP